MVCFPSTKILYSQDIANKHPAPGLEPLLIKLHYKYLYIINIIKKIIF